MNFYCSLSEVELNLNLNKIKTPSNWFVYLDDGWTINKDYAYKGIDLNWCRIDFNNNFKITTNELRDFPLYYNDTCVSNFFSSCGPILPTDATIHWDNNKAIVSYNKDFYPTLDPKQLTFNECSNILFESLCSNIEQFAKTNTKPLLISSHGGVDTLTVKSAFDYLKIKYETFELKNKPTYSKLQEYLATRYKRTGDTLGYGFNRINEKDNCVIITGFHGDEWALRNPYYVHLILSNRDINIINEFDKTKGCYMESFFLKGYKDKCKNKQQTDIKKIMSMIVHDYQIWHLNKTFIFSPFKHIDNLKLLNADSNTIIEQVTNAELSKSIIEKCYPDMLKLLDKQKNKEDPTWIDIYAS